MQALAMGGYGGYVWAAFGFTLISMIGLLWQSWRAQQRRADELASLRSTVRGGAPRPLEPVDGPPARRLVATKPAKALPQTATRQADGPGDVAAPHGFAASRRPSGS